MSNEQQKAKELAILLTAFADGKQLEWFNQSHWIEIPIACSLKNFLVDYTIGVPFRVKPETKRIALTQQDLIDRIKEGKTMWIKHDITNHIENIIAFTPMFVSLHSHIDSVEYPYLMELGTFLDGTPCYKEVECE